jgi:GntR family transcriptional regulator
VPYLHLAINPSSGVPVYRQIMDQIRYYVASGQLASGERLPSIRELAAELHINPTTIVKAYTELEHGGDIEMIHGKGAFVATAAEPKPKGAIEREYRSRAAPLAAAAVQLGLTPERACAILAEEMSRLLQEQRP